jgi:DNA-binding response OmpR family regulator
MRPSALARALLPGERCSSSFELRPLCSVPVVKPRTNGAHVHAYIIEDDYLIAKDLQDMLEQIGFTKFSFARSEDAAIMGADDDEIDLITADVRLLPGDGVNAVETICEKRHLPVLFITAYREELEERKPGAIVLQKPVKQDELTAAVRWLVNGERV